MLIQFVVFVFGLTLGSVVVWLFFRAQIATLIEKLSGKDLELDETRKRRDDALTESKTLKTQLQTELMQRSSVEERAGRIPELELEIEGLNGRADFLQ